MAGRDRRGSARPNSSPTLNLLDQFERVFHRTCVRDGVKQLFLACDQTVLVQRQSSFFSFQSYVISPSIYLVPSVLNDLTLSHQFSTITEKTKDNKEKIKLNRQLPHLVANVAEILDPAQLEEDEEEGAAQDVGKLYFACACCRVQLVRFGL